MSPRLPYFTPQRPHRPTNSDIVPLELANLRLPDPSQFAPAPAPAPLPPQLNASASAPPSAPASAAPAQAQAPSSPSASPALPSSSPAPSPSASAQPPAPPPTSAPAASSVVPSVAPPVAPSAPRSGYAPLVPQVLNIIPDPRLPQPPITPRDKQPRNDRIALPAKLPRFRRRKTSRGPATPATALPRYVIVPSHHRRQCSICNHPEREGLEEEFLRWENPYNTALDYGVKERAIYRHAHALRLFDKRERNIRYALGHVIQRLDSIDISSDAAIRAVRLFTRLSQQGEFVEPSAHESPVHSDVLDRSRPRLADDIVRLAADPRYAGPPSRSLDTPAPLVRSTSPRRNSLRGPSAPRSRKRNSARPSRKDPARRASRHATSCSASRPESAGRTVSRSASRRASGSASRGSSARRASSGRSPARRKNKRPSPRKNSGRSRR